MIIPVRCFTCHKVLGDKWEHYNREVKKQEDIEKNKKYSVDDIRVENKQDTFFLDGYKGKILDKLEISKMCCRRHMLGHVDLIDFI
jgi:DNA-directed RNA polymerase subunit N (RpoN/RPB10)